MGSAACLAHGVSPVLSGLKLLEANVTSGNIDVDEVALDANMVCMPVLDRVLNERHDSIVVAEDSCMRLTTSMSL
jgi:hypothetical protein